MADVRCLADEAEKTRVRAVIGRPYVVAAETTLEGVVAFTPVREAISRAAASAAGPASAEDAIREVLASYKGDPELERLIYEASVKSDLAGQMFVRLVELDPMGAQRQLAVDLRPAFLKMPFAEAVAFWRERGGDPAILEEVLRAYRRRASMATDEQLDVISRRAVEELRRTLEEGNTLRDFSRAIDEQAITLGIAPADPSYLENVYRTNVASAYGAGRWTQMNDPDVIEARPYRQWFTARDNRVRAEHAPMESVVWRADNPAFATIAPPGGFMCRCSIVTVSQEEFDEEGLAANFVTAIPAGFEMTPGFGASSFVR
jgi:SPP1 gp7 family putative phage head morphogenesis protein